MGLNYGTFHETELAITIPGPVLVPDMSQIYPIGFSTQLDNSTNAQQYTANRYVEFPKPYSHMQTLF